MTDPPPSKIVLQGYIVVPVDELAGILEALKTHIELTRAEPGCLVFDVMQDGDDQCRFDVYEEFVDKAAFETHQQRIADSDWGQVTHNVERHYEVTGLE